MVTLTWSAGRTDYGRNIAEVVTVSEGSNAYNSLWQVRNDAWSRLEESTSQLALACSQQRPVEQLTEAVAESLDVLGPIERFWAFPGLPAYQKVRRLFAAGKYDRCATVVARLNRALASDSYRGQSWDVGIDDDLHEANTRSATRSGPNGPTSRCWSSRT